MYLPFSCAIFTLLILAYLTVVEGCSSSVGPARSLTVGEGFTNPLGFHDATPVFSWKLPYGIQKQTAYRIQANVGNSTWDSGWVESDQSVFASYQGQPLHSRDRAIWKVNYRDEHGQEGGWSEPARFELGLLSNADWKAKWIAPQTASDPQKEPIAWLRRQFAMDRPVAKARLYVTAHGLFELELNHKRVGNDHFANGFTSYKNRIDTLTYDVTTQLTAGKNTLQAMLAKGWYAGRQGWFGQLGIFGNDPALLLQLEIQYADGTSTTIVSDESWEATWNGPILASSL